MSTALARVGRDSSPLMHSEVASAVARVRAAASHNHDASRIADALARTFTLWRDCDYARRRDALSAIARAAGYSAATIDISIDALLKPFTDDALQSMAARVSAIGAACRPKTVGFIAAGNVAGAGIHEIVIALIAGAGVVIKTASAEPVFFAEFARTLAGIDGDAAARIEVLNWNRSRDDLTAAMVANCDRVVAYGDDSTIDSLRNRPNLIGFGSRVSAAVIAPGADVSQVDLLARDVALFDQLGCLSLHQVFVVSPAPSAARELAMRMAAALDRLGQSMPPAAIPLRDAVEIRALSERARWRAIAGDPIDLFEGRELQWTVVFEPRLDSFRVSPGFRTVHVTGMRDPGEFSDFLATIYPKIEAMAIAGDEAADLRAIITALGIPYICAPGEMQSPPLDWRHGGGRFLDLMVGTR